MPTKQGSSFVQLAAGCSVFTQDSRPQLLHAHARAAALQSLTDICLLCIV